MLIDPNHPGKVWCPMVRVARHQTGGSNRSPNENERTPGTWNCCIGARCAWWRWAVVDPLSGNYRKASTEKAADQLAELEQIDVMGYCGGAGKPS